MNANREYSTDVGVVLVTYNRIEKLKKTIAAYDGQSLKPKYVLVINNHSTDGTEEWLKNWETLNKDRHIVVTMPENLGGSGGFFYGLKEAMNLESTWIWIADDDAYPNYDAIEIADDYIANTKNQKLVAVCAEVLEDGKIATGHRRRLDIGRLSLKDYEVDPQEYTKAYFKCDVFSYVGVLIKKDVLSMVGLTKKEYFLAYDDTEHSIRISRVGDVECVPRIIINHDVKTRTDKTPIDWKTYYIIRNPYDILKSHWPMIYKYTYFKDMIRAIFHIVIGRKRELYKMRLEALQNVDKGVLGMHPIYKPGWKLKKN